MALSSLLKRSATGVIYVAIIVASLLLFSGWAYPLIAMLFCGLGILEFHHLFCAYTREDNSDGGLPVILTDIFTGVVACSIAPLAYAVLSTGGDLTYPLFGYGVVLVVLFLLRMIIQLYMPSVNPVKSLASSLMSFVYITLPLVLSTLTCYLFGAPIVLIMFVMIWLNDTGAFCVGSMIGRRKLFERISPKKSWEGFWGGMFFCVASAFVIHYCFGWATGISLLQLCIMGVVVSAVATWGDLVESLLKRTAGVKDSGNILPGHGGILDRIDSLLLVAPATFALLALFYIW